MEPARVSGVVSTDPPSYYKPLSRTLYQVLENVGVSKEIRKLWMENGQLHELLSSLSSGPNHEVHKFGSFYEGTRSLDMESDVDSFIEFKEFPVVTACNNSAGNKALLIVQDNRTPIGYAKLQMVISNTPLYKFNAGQHLEHNISQHSHVQKTYDTEGRLVCTLDDKSLALPYQNEAGPALSHRSPECFPVDIVPGLKCKWIPECASEWFNRQRHHNYPTTSTLEKCKTLGCCFVLKGHPRSDEQNLQWRISFSHQERLLVCNFSSVQLKCYVLLKLVKNDFIYKMIGQETLTSYHCKTCVLYMIENTPSHFWRPENLLVCLISCLKMLQIWTHNGICPNYFVTGENMFEGRLAKYLLNTLDTVLSKLISKNGTWLMSITTDDIGSQLERMLYSRDPQSSDTIKLQVEKYIQLHRTRFKVEAISKILKGVHTMIYLCHSRSVHDLVFTLFVESTWPV